MTLTLVPGNVDDDSDQDDHSPNLDDGDDGDLGARTCSIAAAVGSGGPYWPASPHLRGADQEIYCDDDWDEPPHFPSDDHDGDDDDNGDTSSPHVQK